MHFAFGELGNITETAVSLGVSLTRQLPHTHMTKNGLGSRKRVILLWTKGEMSTRGQEAEFQAMATPRINTPGHQRSRASHTCQVETQQPLYWPKEAKTDGFPRETSSSLSTRTAAPQAVTVLQGPLSSSLFWRIP